LSVASGKQGDAAASDKGGGRAQSGSGDIGGGGETEREKFDIGE
jgi:hypothetical protein